MANRSAASVRAMTAVSRVGPDLLRSITDRHAMEVSTSTWAASCAAPTGSVTGNGIA